MSSGVESLEGCDVPLPFTFTSFAGAGFALAARDPAALAILRETTEKNCA